MGSIVSRMDTTRAPYQLWCLGFFRQKRVDATEFPACWRVAHELPLIDEKVVAVRQAISIKSRRDVFVAGNPRFRHSAISSVVRSEHDAVRKRLHHCHIGGEF